MNNRRVHFAGGFGPRRFYGGYRHGFGYNSGFAAPFLLGALTAPYLFGPRPYYYPQHLYYY